MIFTTPITFMHMPTIGIVIPVGVNIVSALVGSAIPVARMPTIVVSVRLVIAIDPGITRTRRRRTRFVAERRRWGTDANAEADLGVSGGSGKQKCQNSCGGCGESC
jgi:hypothetical protein